MKYVIKRLVALIPVLAVVAVIVFLLLHLGSSDPAVLIAGDNASTADIEQIRKTLGLDRPLIEQFFTWLWRILHGDMGVSVFTGLPVTKMIAQRLEPTFWITLSTMLFAVVFAVPMGIIAAWRVGTWIDRCIMALAVLAFSLPVFLIGYFLIFGFSIGGHIRHIDQLGDVSYARFIVPGLVMLGLPLLPLPINGLMLRLAIGQPGTEVFSLCGERLLALFEVRR